MSSYRWGCSGIDTEITFRQYSKQFSNNECKKRHIVSVVRAIDPLTANQSPNRRRTPYTGSDSCCRLVCHTSLCTSNYLCDSEDIASHSSEPVAYILAMDQPPRQFYRALCFCCSWRHLPAGTPMISALVDATVFS